MWSAGLATGLVKLGTIPAGYTQIQGIADINGDGNVI
jgi:hypothetical protein